MSKLIPVTEAGRTIYLDCESVALIRPTHATMNPEQSDVMVKGGLMLRIEEAPDRLHRIVTEGRQARA